MKFDELVSVLNAFRMPSAPISERHIEIELIAYLTKNKLNPKRQLVSEVGRTDIVVDNICIELKHNAGLDCSPQLDRYATAYIGLVLFCWSASKPLKAVFKSVKKTAKIPIELVEMKTTGSMF